MLAVRQILERRYAEESRLVTQRSVLSLPKAQEEHEAVKESDKTSRDL